MTVSSKNDIGERSGRIIVNAENGEDTEIITVTQLDYINYYFSEIDENGSIINKSSSEYNHFLAQWSMALSYAAYNPVEYELIPGVPSSFMQEPYDDESKTAESDLESLGFDATSYNYDNGYSGYAAHTIGHRNIFFDENYVIGDEDNDINGSNVFIDNTSSFSFGNLSVLETDNRSTLGFFADSVGMDSGIVETTSESDSDIDTIRGRFSD